MSILLQGVYLVGGGFSSSFERVFSLQQSTGCSTAFYSSLQFYSGILQWCSFYSAYYSKQATVMVDCLMSDYTSVDLCVTSE